MSKQSKNWTNYEDRVLKQLKEERGIEKWSIISKLMEEEFKINGKSGKRCRDRYFHHLDCKVKKENWTFQEQQLLQKLHNEKGNRWMDIAEELKRSDNDVKNHFHSKFRRAIRRINSLISLYMRSQFKPLKNNIISKILKTSQDFYAQENKQEETNSKFCYGKISIYTGLKNRIFSYLKINEKQVQSELSQLKILIKQINQFSKLYKKKGTSKINIERVQNQASKYKGKEILLLLDQNKLKESNSQEQRQGQSLNHEQIDNKNSDNSEDDFRNRQPVVYNSSPYLPQHSMMYPFLGNPYYNIGYPWASIMNYPNPLVQNYMPFSTPVHQRYDSTFLHDNQQSLKDKDNTSSMNQKKGGLENSQLKVEQQECKKEYDEFCQ